MSAAFMPASGPFNMRWAISCGRTVQHEESELISRTSNLPGPIVTATVPAGRAVIVVVVRLVVSMRTWILVVSSTETRALDSLNACFTDFDVFGANPDNVWVMYRAASLGDQDRASAGAEFF